MRVILQTWCEIQRAPSSFRYVDCGPGHIECNYSYAYSGFNIQVNVSALPLEISRQFNVRYNANLVPNTANTLRVTLYELCSRTYTMHFQLHIFRLQNSIERICAAIRDNTLQCPLYSKFGAKYSAHHPVYPM
jgi:hypothetical protein